MQSATFRLLPVTGTMGRMDREGARPRRWLFTSMALAAALGIVVYNVSGNPLPQAKPLVFRKLPALLKPEPQTLLAMKGELALTPTQESSLKDLQNTWNIERKERLAAMSMSSREVGAKGRSSLPQMNEDLASYSQLSRQYDLARDRYWSKALAQLTKAQRAKVPQR